MSAPIAETHSFVEAEAARTVEQQMRVRQFLETKRRKRAAKISVSKSAPLSASRPLRATDRATDIGSHSTEATKGTGNHHDGSFQKQVARLVGHVGCGRERDVVLGILRGIVSVVDRGTGPTGLPPQVDESSAAVDASMLVRRYTDDSHITAEANFAPAGETHHSPAATAAAAGVNPEEPMPASNSVDGMSSTVSSSVVLCARCAASKMHETSFGSGSSRSSTSSAASSVSDLAYSPIYHPSNTAPILSASAFDQCSAFHDNEYNVRGQPGSPLVNSIDIRTGELPHPNRRQRTTASDLVTSFSRTKQQDECAPTINSGSCDGNQQGGWNTTAGVPLIDEATLRRLVKRVVAVVKRKTVPVSAEDRTSNMSLFLGTPSSGSFFADTSFGISPLGRGDFDRVVRLGDYPELLNKVGQVATEVGGVYVGLPASRQRHDAMVDDIRHVVVAEMRLFREQLALSLVAEHSPPPRNHAIE